MHYGRKPVFRAIFSTRSPPVISVVTGALAQTVRRPIAMRRFIFQLIILPAVGIFNGRTVRPNTLKP